MTSQHFELQSLLAAKGLDPKVYRILGVAQDATFSHVVVVLPQAVVMVSSQKEEATMGIVPAPGIRDARCVRVNGRGSWIFEEHSGGHVRGYPNTFASEPYILTGSEEIEILGNQTYQGAWMRSRSVPETQGARRCSILDLSNPINSQDGWSKCSYLLPGRKDFYIWRREHEAEGPLTVWQEGADRPILLHRWDCSGLVVQSVHPHFPSAIASSSDGSFRYWLFQGWIHAFQPKDEVWCWERLTPEPDGYAVRGGNTSLHSVFTDAWGQILKIFLLPDGDLRIERSPRPRGKWLTAPGGTYLDRISKV